MEEISLRDNYKVVKPLLNVPKQRLKEYLDKDSIRYFIDSSNSDIKYKRNYFRHNFTDKLLHEFEGGIIKSFEYLQEDKKELDRLQIEVFHHKELYILEIDNFATLVRVVDKYLKKLGYLLSSAQRDELTREKSIVFGGVWAVERVDNEIYIAPYIKEVMPKRFKEECRIAKVPSKVRGYYYQKRLEPKKVLRLYRPA